MGFSRFKGTHADFHSSHPLYKGPTVQLGFALGSIKRVTRLELAWVGVGLVVDLVVLDSFGREWVHTFWPDLSFKIPSRLLTGTGWTAQLLNCMVHTCSRLQAAARPLWSKPNCNLWWFRFNLVGVEHDSQQHGPLSIIRGLDYIIIDIDDVI